jgi:hypothetical protein
MASFYKDPPTILSELGISEPEEIDVEVIAQYCGATVVYEPLTGCEARLLGLNDRAIITVKNDAVFGRQRFSASHELGHWMRDRGKVATFSCNERIFKTEWSGGDPEVRANQFAAELLLPEFIFRQYARAKPMTFSTVKELSQKFQTSLTATAIRFISLGSYPAILFCIQGRHRKWSCRGEDIFVKTFDEPGRNTYAFDLINDSSLKTASGEACADGWINHRKADRVTIHEDSIRIGSDLILSIVWFTEEEQFLELQSQW